MKIISKIHNIFLLKTFYKTINKSKQSKRKIDKQYKMRMRENTRATSWKLEKIWTNDNTELNLKSTIGKTKTQSIYIIEPTKDSGSTSGSGTEMGLKIG